MGFELSFDSRIQILHQRDLAVVESELELEPAIGIGKMKWEMRDERVEKTDKAKQSKAASDPISSLMETRNEKSTWRILEGQTCGGRSNGKNFPPSPSFCYLLLSGWFVLPPDATWIECLVLRDSELFAQTQQVNGRSAFAGLPIGKLDGEKSLERLEYHIWDSFSLAHSAAFRNRAKLHSDTIKIPKPRRKQRRGILTVQILLEGVRDGDGDEEIVT